MTPPRKKILFLRWSFLKMLANMPRVLREWQAGDGREEAVAKHVLSTARPGDVADAIRAIDEFAYDTSFLMNVGDEKGLILDEAVKRAKPKRILELGAYCGYSALRMAQAAPEAHIYSVEFSAANAGVARRIFAHAGVDARITIVVGSLGDGGATARVLREQHRFGPGTVDFMFVDHDKAAYLPDLKLVEAEGWLHAGSVVVADNIKFPGAPEYRAYVEQNEGKTWRTTAHETHVEYQSMVKDIVLVSERLA
jgi:catechol O-methyltransferase